MTAIDIELLDTISDMEKQAAEIGLCPLPFRILYTRVQELILQRDRLLSK